MINDPKVYGKVALLYGGQTAEREVSLSSGGCILEALRALNIDVHPIDVDKNIISVLQRGKFDRVFNILHGPMGEDGTIQGLLEFMNIPYTGSGVLGSAIAMDKFRTKQIWQASGLPTAAFVRCTSDDVSALAHLKLPLAIKPIFDGSSVGITKLTRLEDFPEAYRLAAQYGEVMAEEWIEGKEFSIGIVGERALSPILIAPKNKFYDYEAKYSDASGTMYLCPAGLSPSDETELKALSLQGFKACACEGWGRMDAMQDHNGQFYLLEMNTTPGMTPTSLLPKMAKVDGWGFEELVERVLAQTLSLEVLEQDTDNMSVAVESE